MNRGMLGVWDSDGACVLVGLLVRSVDRSALPLEALSAEFSEEQEEPIGERGLRMALTAISLREEAMR